MKNKKLHLSVTLLLLVMFITSFFIKEIEVRTSIILGVVLLIYSYSYKKKFYIGSE